MAIKSATAALCCVAAVLVLAAGGADGLSCNTGWGYAGDGNGAKWFEGYPLKQNSSSLYTACWSVFMTGTKSGYSGTMQIQYLDAGDATKNCTDANKANYAAGMSSLLSMMTLGSGVVFSNPTTTCCTTDNCNAVTLAASLARPTPILLLLALLGMLCLKQLV